MLKRIAHYIKQRFFPPAGGVRGLPDTESRPHNRPERGHPQQRVSVEFPALAAGAVGEVTMTLSADAARKFRPGPLNVSHDSPDAEITAFGFVEKDSFKVHLTCRRLNPAEAASANVEPLILWQHAASRSGVTRHHL